MIYKINVLTLSGVSLVFTISSYTIIEGDFLEFIDSKTKKIKRFHSSRCEIDEVVQ